MFVLQQLIAAAGMSISRLKAVYRNLGDLGEECKRSRVEDEIQDVFMDWLRDEEAADPSRSGKHAERPIVLMLMK